MNRFLFRSVLASLRVALLVGVMACPASAQDGKLLDSSAVKLQEDAVKKLQSARPELRSFLEQIEIKTITYLSDGLKVKGYLAVPKKGDNLPCVIFNRGGEPRIWGLDR